MNRSSRLLAPTNVRSGSRFAALAGLGLVAPMLAAFSLAAGCLVGPDAGGTDAPLGEAQQAVASTCITIQRGTSGAASDALIDSSAVNTNYGSGTTMRIATRQEGLLAFDLSAIPAGALVTSASVKLWVNNTSSSAPIELHKATAAWSENSVTYAAFNQHFDPAIAGSFTAPTGNVFKTVDVTTLAQGWVTGPNYGVLLSTNTTAAGAVSVQSSDGSPLARRPSLDICYTLDPCANVVCPPADACHAASTCNPANGQCVPGAALGDTTSNLTHHWTFDEPSGGTALDSAGTSDGTLGASALRTASFDGSGAIALTPTGRCDMGASVDFGTAPGAFGTGDFTVSYWVALSSAANGDLIGNRVDGSAGNFLSGRVKGFTSVEMYADYAGTNGANANNYPGSINDSKWHNIVYTRSGTALALYIDGALIGSGTSAAPTNILGNDPFKIGRNLPYCLSSFQSLPALFDDVRIYSRQLDACAVADLAATYAGTPASPPADPPAPTCAGDFEDCSKDADCCSGFCYADFGVCF